MFLLHSAFLTFRSDGLTYETICRNIVIRRPIFGVRSGMSHLFLSKSIKLIKMEKEGLFFACIIHTISIIMVLIAATFPIFDHFLCNFYFRKKLEGFAPDTAKQEMEIFNNKIIFWNSYEMGQYT